MGLFYHSTLQRTSCYNQSFLIHFSLENVNDHLQYERWHSEAPDGHHSQQEAGVAMEIIWIMSEWIFYNF